MTKLRISDSLALPLDAVTQAMAWLGRRGSGKSYGSTKLAELFYDAGAQFVAIDPVGIWYGLRLAADGKEKGLDLPIFGGLHGDIPLEVGGGALIADVVVNRNISAVIDVSQFESDMDKARFAQAFADRFFFLKKSIPSAVHVFVEEAQEFIPQNTQKGEEKMLHAWQRMIRLGRNYGIGVSMITQRPQDVNKKALNQAECLFCFQLTGPQERDAVKKWISEHGLDEDLDQVLPQLKQGHAHVWSPVWLDINSEVHIAEKRTFAAGSTPKVGAKPVKIVSLEPLELEQISKDMAATIERQKANDPKELKAKLAALQRELDKERSSKPAAAGKMREVKVVDQRDIAQALRKRDQEWAKAVRDLQRATLTAVQKAARQVEEAAQIGFTAPEFPRLDESLVPAVMQIGQDRTPVRMNQGHVDGVAVQKRTDFSSAASNGDAKGLSRPQMALILALAEAEAIGRTTISRSWLAFLAGVSSKSSGFEKNVSTLRTGGFIDYPGSNLVMLTDAGRSIAPSIGRPLGADELFDRICRLVSSPQAELLKVLRSFYPRALSREDLAERAGVSQLSSGYEKNVSTLSSRELVNYPQQGMVRLQDWVMLEEI
jgi:hypothetical protein